MKITETITRECCDARLDLKEMYAISKPPGRQWYFCKYCGRQWENLGLDKGMQPLPWPWEVEKVYNDMHG